MKGANESRKPRLTIACENYWPEVASTAQLITELAEGLTSDFAVEVLTTQPRYHGRYSRHPRRENRNNVTIRRLVCSRFPKSSRVGRLVNWLTFLLSLCLAVATRWRRRTYLFVTNPPTAPWSAVISRALRQRSYVLVYDLYPDLAEAVGAVARGGALARAFDAVNRFSFRRADGLIAVGHDMKARLREKCGEAVAVHLIPNWADPDLVSPRDKASSGFARRHGLVDRFVFLYAGNLGLFQDLETLVHAVHSLDGGGEDAILIFVGDGGKRKTLEGIARQSDRVRVFDYVPYEELGDLYAAADVGLIALEPGVERTNVPSKTYSIMAAGIPFLAVASASSDLDALADRGCGVVADNEPSSVAASMLRFLREREQVAAAGQRARQVFLENYTKQAIIDRYRQLLSQGGSK